MRAFSSASGEVVRHADAGIEDAARRLGRLAGQLDPASAHVEDLSGLRAIAAAADQVRRDEALVTERVAAARARGRSGTGSPWLSASPGRLPRTGSRTRPAERRSRMSGKASPGACRRPGCQLPNVTSASHGDDKNRRYLGGLCLVDDYRLRRADEVARRASVVQIWPM